jgi:tripeptidyl-peptidase II
MEARMKKLLLVLSLILTVVAINAQKKADSGWEFLSTSTIGAKDFIEKHPSYDGRGVIIAVCDSGVDLGLSGLSKTTTGEDKIIDARDFSGEFAVTAENAEISKTDNSLYSGDGRRLYGWDKTGAALNPDEVYVGYFKEELAKNAEVKDLNGNGSETDVFGFILFKDKSLWKVILDKNGDGDLEGENPLTDFAENRQQFQLEGKDRHEQYLPMNMALNIDGEKKEAVFVMGSGSHGTHVAGIAAGYKIDGQENYNGIAPGAYIISCKIGNNSFSGGATVPGSMISAWRYAVKRAKELKMPLVIQMSYGIGSEDEGQSKIEELIDTLLAENPEVSATVSNGNEGPQISTAGLPSCAENVLAIGGLLAKTTARDLYGAELKNDEIFSFSSRGAEFAKPDFVCPGFAASTVPVWEEGKNVMRGTSMASPQAAGACALILSAAKAEKLPMSRDLVYSALRRSGRELPGYTVTDQGWGLINIERAYEIYKSLAKRTDPVLSFKVETRSPEMPDNKGPAVFYRGAFYPRGAERQEITVSPKFSKDLSKDKMVRFYEAFDLASEGGFFSLPQGSCYMKAEEPAKIYVNFNEAVLQKPGLYSGKIMLYLKNSSAGERTALGPEWIIPVAVAVPHEIDAKTGVFPKVEASVEKAKVFRSFYRVNSGSDGNIFKVTLEDKPKGKVSFYLADPEGREHAFAVLSPEKREQSVTLTAPFEKGVYEIDLYGNYLNTADIRFRIEAAEIPVKACASSPLKINAGAPSKTKLTVTSKRGETLKTDISANIIGTLIDKNEKVSGPEYTQPFQIGQNDRSVDFELEMSSADFRQFTDIAVEVLDENDIAVYSDGMTNRMISLSVGEEEGLKTGEKYTLKVYGATADPDGTPKWNIKIKENHIYKEKVAASLGKNDSAELYPDKEKEIALTFDTPPPAIPSSASYLLKVNFQQKTAGSTDPGSGRFPFSVVLPLKME